MLKRCEHCGAQHKSSVACGWFKDKPEWVAHQGFDPPCSMDEYDEGQRQLRRDTRIGWALFAIGLVSLVMLLT